MEQKSLILKRVEPGFYRSTNGIDQHKLHFKKDGHWFCSCGQWNSQVMGSLNDEYCKINKIYPETINEWHKAHKNAIVIETASREEK